MVKTAGKKAADAAVAAPPPKLTMMNFFSKAPVKASDSDQGLASKGQEPVVSVEDAAIAKNNAICVHSSKPEANRSDDTPQRPSNPSPPSPGAMQSEGGAKPGEDDQVSEEGKVVNLTIDKFDAVDKDDDDCVMIESSPEDVKAQNKGASSANLATAGAMAAASSSASAASGGSKGKALGATTKAAKQSQASKGAGTTSKAASGATAEEKKAGKQPVNSIKQAFTSCTNFFKPAEKKEIKVRERPAHPAGAAIEVDESLLVAAQFLSTFSDVLGIEAMSAQELQAELGKPHPSESLCAIHVALLLAIVKSGETPDEARMIDGDTWPAVLREHLEDTRAADCSAVREILESSEYAFVNPELRLQTLCLLVDDCLQTPLIRKFVDGSLSKIEAYHREQQLEEIGDKYQKKQGEGASAMEASMAAFVVEKPEVGQADMDEDVDEGTMTERQRLLVKQREETARIEKMEEDKRRKEIRKLEEEEEKKKNEKQKQQRAEDRARSLVVCGDIVRVPVVTAEDGPDVIGYYAMDCWSKDGERQLLFRREPKDAEGNGGCKWSAIESIKDVDALVERWSPMHPESERGFQKKLRDIIPHYDAAPSDVSAPEGTTKGDETGDSPVELGVSEPAKANETVEGEAGSQDSEDKSEDVTTETLQGEEVEEAEEMDDIDPVAMALMRCKEVVMELEARTPENMFSDHNVWRGKRTDWSENLLSAMDTPGVAAALGFFETELKRGKMQEGWEGVRVKWLQDAASAKTCAGVNYLVKQLKVYIGKEKARPGKLASASTAPQRLTRSMDPCREGTRRSTRKRTSYMEEEEEDDGEEELSDGESVMIGDDSDFEPEADGGEEASGNGTVKRRKGSRKGGGKAFVPMRKSQRTNKGQKAVVEEAVEERGRRGPARATRSTRSTAANGDKQAISYKEDEGESSDSDF